MHRWLRQLPNFISSIRILLIAPITMTLMNHRYPVTLWLFAAAALSDAADGFLARRFGWQSQVGAVLDPIADKLILAAVFITLTVLGRVPIWLTYAVLMRDFIIILGAISYRVWLGPVEARPSSISKLNTVCQMTFILAVICGGQFAWPPSWVPVCLGALVFVTVAVSGLDYVLVYGRQAARAGGRPVIRGTRGSKPA